MTTNDSPSERLQHLQSIMGHLTTTGPQLIQDLSCYEEQLRSTRHDFELSLSKELSSIPPDSNQSRIANTNLTDKTKSTCFSFSPSEEVPTRHSGTSHSRVSRRISSGNSGDLKATFV
eukprot:gene2496-5426_t